MTMSMGFHYKEGVRVGYDISFPNAFGGRSVLSNVASSDKARIIREVKACGWKTNEIEVVKN